MEKTRWNKKYLAGFLAALAVAVPAAGITFGSAVMESFAVQQVDTGRSCSLTLGVGAESVYAQELAAVSWDAYVYRIASMDVKGACTAQEGFEAVTEKINGAEELTAQETEALALEAAAVVGWQADGSWEDVKEPDVQIRLENGTGRADGLATGIYLVLPKDALTQTHAYQFQPSLITIPRQLESGDWTYDVTASLKPEQKPRYGSLRIRKTLDSFNESLGPVTFVFQIEGTDENGETVYSNVAATTHSSAGTVDAVAERIPAGTRVTVTEVYSGASYELVSQGTQEGLITADQELGMTFTNTYDDGLVPGYGAVNQFDYDEDAGWTWNRLDGGEQE
ncbi:DUF5979 domain-containing protein [Mordavella massiliensis]|uniref:DUF5979 domain-containing protein n=1 Tax=Mordavella massiliensis TaxID=1871024 RepID=A0A938XBY6_9CLOT|nr:DUF5979 domain-containing protein [Mordavella massiliensis]MBM6948050.1 hypothetical protein [Mordavella massiliensis]